MNARYLLIRQPDNTCMYKTAGTKARRRRRLGLIRYYTWIVEERRADRACSGSGRQIPSPTVSAAASAGLQRRRSAARSKSQRGEPPPPPTPGLTNDYRVPGGSSCSQFT